MKARVTILVVTFALVATAFASKWSDEYLKKIREIEEPPSTEDIVLLAVLASNESSKEEVKMVRSEAWEILKKNDDFTDVLLARIQDSRKAWKKTGISNHYDAERSSIIQSMGGLRDVQVVEELGELLSDMEWTEDPIEHTMRGADYGLTSPNGKLAARALARLVENPPINKDPFNYLDSDIEPWRLWYQQVKAGNRTFRFKGDPNEYSLTTKASAEIREPKIDRESRSNEVPASSVETEKKATGLPIWPLALAGVLLAVAFWFATKRKAAAS
jgi:hypothetical protein